MFGLTFDRQYLKIMITAVHTHTHTLPGLQLGYFLHRAGRNYVIFEKNSIVGKSVDGRVTFSVTSERYVLL